MIVQFFNRGKGNGSGPIDYLLGKNRDRDGATLERGDVEIVKTLIDTSPFKKKYTSGCLSFFEDEAHFERDQIERFMDDFERVLFPGLDKDQYSCLWVTHIDKGRLELNFLIPNIELQTGKRLQPYFYKADRKRLDSWRTIQNIKHQLHDPDDPKNARTFSISKGLPKNVVALRERIETVVQNLVVSGALKNRNELIDFFESEGLSVKRKTKKSISISNPLGARNLRLTGDFYSDKFDPTAESSDAFSRLRGESKSSSETFESSSGERLEEARSTFIATYRHKRKENRKRYPLKRTNNINQPPEKQRTDIKASDITSANAKKIIDDVGASLSCDSDNFDRLPLRRIPRFDPKQDRKSNSRDSDARKSEGVTDTEWAFYTNGQRSNDFDTGKIETVGSIGSLHFTEQEIKQESDSNELRTRSKINRSFLSKFRALAGRFSEIREQFKRDTAKQRINTTRNLSTLRGAIEHCKKIINESVDSAKAKPSFESEIKRFDEQCEHIAMQSRQVAELASRKEIKIDNESVQKNNRGPVLKM